MAEFEKNFVALAHDDIYSMACVLRLNDGREIILRGMKQDMTYEGLLVGTPDHESNQRRIQRAVREAASRGNKVHLIEPPRRDYHRKPGDMGSVVVRNPNRIPEWLPEVCCIGRFSHVRPARDQSQDMSILTIIWFQDEFAPPIMLAAYEAIANIDWNSVAEDVSW